MIHRVKVYPGTYLDSVLQMGGTRALSQVEGVDWAAAAMATPANIDTLVGEGFDRGGLDGASADDLFVAVRAADDDVADQAVAAGEDVLFAAKAGGSGGAGGAAERPVRTIEEAVDRQAGSNVALVSVPGDYAALEAHKALTAGLHVLLFSDNVSVADEIELKDRATDLGRLVMGPGAGTAMLGGTGLGFANAVQPGSAGDGRPRVGVVAAAGTGAQEAMSLLDRWGATVTHVIGLGGRDLNDAVDGRMAKLAVAALRDDPGTDAILLVSKPPSERVAHAVVDVARAGTTPFVAAMVGLEGGADFGVPVLPTLEQGVMAALATVGLEAPDVTAGLEDAAATAGAALDPSRTLVRGLFSGGTLCYESLVILTRLLGPVWSNTPLDHAYEVPAPDGAHVCLDLGEEEYTKGRPHPMIDPAARVEWILKEGSRPDVAVVLLDVVLGHGSHSDPAGELAPACEEIRAGGAGPQVVAYVLGTEHDPQGFASQVARMEAAGCIVTPTAARASLVAAAIALRQPSLVATRL
ncbi:MAG: FdrA protein [Actinomycetota bacterium]|nr:FdrA protein [Actinomycetota bacterium]